MVFAKMLHESGKIEDVNYQIYLKWFNSFNEDCPVHQIVYVKTDPEVCHERIFKRSRAGEGCIPLDYLEECHKYHEAMLDLDSTECVCRDQLVLDGNVDIFESSEALESMIKSVRSFIGAVRQEVNMVDEVHLPAEISTY
jgi:deoxyadenosine/deoxycytidine kinase